MGTIVRFALAVATIGLIVSPFMPALSPSTRAQVDDPSIAATGLVNPRGFTWDAEGQLVVAEAGAS